jgi:hypothetical protein
MRNFSGGLNAEMAGHHLPITSLTQCCNMKYVKDGDSTILTIRQGTTKISHTTVGIDSAISGCTYYAADAKYILATTAKLYYLDGSYDPVEIGAISGTPTFTEFKGKLIIHDSGTTKAWNGTTFETLPCRYDDVAIETGDGSTVEFDGTLANPVVSSTTLTITYTASGVSKTLTSAASGALAGDVTATEIITDQHNRDFSAANEWANSGGGTALASFDSTGDLTITANAAGDYCTLPVANATTVAGKSYVMTFSVANLVSTWTIKSYDGTQTIGTVSAAGAQTFAFTASTTGGFRIVAVGATSSGDFDNFTLSPNAVNYTDGAYHFIASAAPDNTTPVYATYEKTSGAPKSKAGFVRASRLYMWGDSDNPSRLWYSGVNDEDAWDSTSGGGYIDIDPLDGYSLIGCCNFFETIVCLKENSTHRVNNFPGDTNFDVEPVLQGVGSGSYRTCVVAGNYVTFLSPLGWLGLSASTDYGDISMTEDFGKNIRSDILPAAINSASKSLCYAEYNEIDKQLWISLAESTYVLVCNMETGGQLSLYCFAIADGYASFKFVNGEMLIGTSRGDLYKLNNTAADGCKDDTSSYASYTYVRGAMTDWGLPENRKHNKLIKVHLYGSTAATATLNIYTNKDYSTVAYTASLNSGTSSTMIRKKFNYREVMFRLENIYGAAGAEFAGVDFTSAIIGR